jgi:hypothetical protein
MAYVFALAGTSVLGFLAGLLSFKVKSRWCPTCGSTLACARCQRAAAQPMTGRH